MSKLCVFFSKYFVYSLFCHWIMHRIELYNLNERESVFVFVVAKHELFFICSSKEMLFICDE